MSADVEYMESNYRNPSKHRIEEHQMLNFIMHNRKLINAGKMKGDRVALFEKLLETGEKYKRVNQYM